MILRQSAHGVHHTPYCRVRLKFAMAEADDLHWKAAEERLTARMVERYPEPPPALPASGSGANSSRSLPPKHRSTRSQLPRKPATCRLGEQPRGMLVWGG